MSISVLQTLDGVEGTQEIELYLWVVAAWAAGMACSGGSTASRAGDGGEGVTAAAVFRRVSGGLVGALGGGVRSGLWAAATSMAAVLGSRGGGSRTGAEMRNQVLGEGRRRKEIYGGAFCPGSWLHLGQKGFLGGPGKFPARGPPLVPGGSTTRDKRGPFSLVPA